LPVKLDWDDVPGWWAGGWSGAGSNVQEYADCQSGFIDFCWEEAKAANPGWNCQGELTRPYLDCLRAWTASSCESVLQDDECEETCPAIEGEDECYEPGEFVQSYVIDISGGELRLCDGATTTSYTEVLDASEFFAPCPCFFKSNQTYNWTVRACCGEDGTNCGPPSSASFSTSLAPEPILPRDPDWEGSGQAEPDWTTSTHEGHPVELGWCEVEEALSYIIQAYEWGTKYCPEILCPYEPNDAMLFHKEGLAVPQDFWSFYFDLDSFTKETLYDWEIATCFDEYGEDCGEFGQRWKFFGHAELAKVELVLPEDGGCVNLSSRLEWAHVGGAHSYRYNINPVPLLQYVLAISSFPFKDIWNYLELDTTYTWQVKACWDDGGNDCQEESWSDEWEFTTTGATPTNFDVEREPVTGNALIPIKLNWDDMPCAASYEYEVTEEGGIIIARGVLAGLWPPASELSINYDSGIQHPKQNTNYLWWVKTCADTEGNICGNRASGSFTTFGLSAPENPHPSDGGDFYTYENYLKWGPVLGGAFYEYEIIGEIGPTIVPSNYTFINTSELTLGTYTWRVRACLDANCQEAGPFSDDWSFDLVEGEAPGAGGIVPCGRYTDNPNTSWSERDPCGVEHIFIMIFLIIEFLLWKVIPIVLALLVLASGVIFYFSGQLGISAPIIQVKSLWKAAGLGLAVIFLAWTGISLILGLFGYQAGLFGDWWKIEF